MGITERYIKKGNPTTKIIHLFTQQKRQHKAKTQKRE